ncbi:Lrp/AsnC family transcriptional regulator [Desulfosarcina ovata]|uniref:AsnC family transcriptional regulator n=2 Tax=Desulfosarcina ovata TaxID=83564 RepID=A0A5K8A499_9BACT|nr:Lrp/AsnC family transcriptional regulator [Desulfosarcina ovata]BBO79868.1 AsnC family transcriptional regulator [Desulfosarcina ovata subsp. sediminis]BBO87174.1 AsnC family transcriptional regulator [Desulfosarcina ovata subsp. ovata]
MIDDISLNILKILQQKARIPNVEVARQVGMAPSAVLERIRKLEKMGYIDGYEVRLNPERFGKSQVAFIQVHTSGKTEGQGLVKTLSGLPQVQEIHYVAGKDSYLLKVRETDTQALGRLIRERIAPIKGVTGTTTTIVMNTFKETARIPIDDQDLIR